MVVALSILGMCLVSLPGFYTRPIADDYVFAVLVGEGAIFDVFYNHHTGRIGNALLLWVSYITAPLSMHLVAALSLAGFAGAIGLLSHSVMAATGLRPRRIAPILLGATGALIILLDQEPVYQTLYWVPGVITHTLPPMALMALVGIAIRVKGPRARCLMCAGAFAAGLFLGTVSEAITVVAAALIVVVPWRRYPMCLMATLVSGCFLGLLFVSLTPAGIARRAGKNPFDLDVIHDSVGLTGAALANLASNLSIFSALAAGVLAGLLVGGRIIWNRATRIRLLLRPLVAVVVASVLVQYIVRFGYGERLFGVPHRTWMNFVFLVVLLLLWCGLLVGTAIRRRKDAVAAVAAAVIMAAGCSYVLDLRALGQQMAVRATAWDARYDRIARERDSGLRVARCTPLLFADLADPCAPDTPGWLSQIAPKYFGVERLERSTP